MIKNTLDINKNNNLIFIKFLINPNKNIINPRVQINKDTSFNAIKKFKKLEIKNKVKIPYIKS